MQETEQREPRTPQEHLFQELYVYDSKNEYELVKNEVPKFLFEMLVLGDSQLAEDQLLDAATNED